jgi:uncharacterized protein
MVTRQDHSQYIKDHPNFVVDCSNAIFSLEQLDLLRKYGHWFRALTDGTMKPVTPQQENFIEAAQMNKPPISLEEKTWVTYLTRKKMESDPEQAQKLRLNYQYEQDTFYNRDMAKQMKKMMSSEMGKNHWR